MRRDGRHRRIGILGALTFALCVYWIASAQNPPANAPPAKLDLHRPVERTIGPGQSASFSIQAQAGNFVRVVAVKRGVDAVLTVTAPGGATLFVADSPNVAFGPVPAAWIAGAPGTYTVKVTKSQRSKESGHYTIELTDVREPTDQDRARIQAQSKLYEASAKDRGSSGQDRKPAIDLYQEAAKLWHEQGDREEEALCLHRIGLVYSDLGDQQKALDFARQALALRQAAGDHAGEATTLNNIGVAYARLDDTAKALESYQQALAARREAGDLGGEEQTLANAAAIYAAQGEQQKVLDEYQQILSIRRAVGDRAGQALALLNLAITYTSLGEQQKAQNSYNEALAIRRELNDRAGQAQVLMIQGSVFRDLGAEEEALQYYEQALALARASGERLIEADTVNCMGDALFFLGEKQKAIDTYQEAIRLERVAGSRSGEALAQIGLANVYCDLGRRQKPPDFASAADKQKALEMYQQALATGRSMGDRAVEVFALMGAGVVSAELGDTKKAMDYLNPARFLFSVAHLRTGEGWALYETARVERDRGNLAQARTLVSRARDIIEALRSKLVNQDLRASFFAAVHDCYGLELDILMRLHEADPKGPYEAEALSLSERARARVLLEALGETRADIHEGVDPALIERERQIEIQLDAKENARMQAIASGRMDKQAADLEKAVRDLTGKYENLQAEIRARSPRYAALNFPQPLSLDQIQKQVLDADTVLLEYSLGDQRSFLWAVTTDRIASFVLPNASEVEKAARTFHDALVDPDKASVAAGADLSRMLLHDAAPLLGNKRLLIVTDGALQYLPFASLPDPNHTDQPLVAVHEIASVPSASTLAILRQENAHREPAPKALAVLADPVFSADDSRLGRTMAARRPAPAHSNGNASLQRSISDLGLAGFRLARLPGTRREAAGILALVPPTARKEALDFDASRATLTSPEMRQFRILHLATHGLLNTEHPELSGVVLSLVDRRGQTLDGFLRLHEIYNLKLSADLVVLSACQTGLGKEIEGEGLVGLTRGFMYAGAPRVVASLWKVDDRATAELMKHFYSAMLTDHEPAAAALRRAQLAMWKTQGWESPYYWAAFVLQGDWK